MDFPGKNPRQQVPGDLPWGASGLFWPPKLKWKSFAGVHPGSPSEGLLRGKKKIGIEVPFMERGTWKKKVLCQKNLAGEVKEMKGLTKKNFIKLRAGG